MPLVVDGTETVAFGHILLQLRQAGGYAFGHVDYIAVGHRRYGDADGRKAVHLHAAAGRTDIALADSSQLTQAEIRAVARGDGQVLEFFERREASCRINAQAVMGRLNSSGINDAVLAVEGGGDVGHRQPAGSEQ